MISISARIRYEFTGNEMAPRAIHYGTVIDRDKPGYPGGSAEGMLHVRWDDHGVIVPIHERHVTEV